MDKRELLRSKVTALYSWALRNGMTREDVYDEGIKMAEEGGKAEGEDSSEEDEKGQDNAGGSEVGKSKERAYNSLTKLGGVPETVHEIIDTATVRGQRAGTFMAPRHRPPGLGFRPDVEGFVQQLDSESDDHLSESNEITYDVKEDNGEALCSFFQQKGKENEANPTNAEQTTKRVSNFHCS